MTILDAEKQIDNLILSGLYKVVDIGLFKASISLAGNLSEYNKEYMEETLESYKKYLKLLESLPEKYRIAFLETLKRTEIKHNQEVENENPFIVELYHSLGSTNSIDLAVSMRDRDITQDDIKLLHYKLMQGIDFKSQYDYRTKNNIIVEGMKNRARDIHFIPIDKDKIDESMQLICDYLNQNATKEDDILVKPFTAHALIAALQAFSDGNTRLARLVSHIKIWQLSKQLGITSLNLPALYMSKSFYLMREAYRENIRIIVNSNSEKELSNSLNKWHTYNLHAFNEQIHFGTKNIEDIKRRI